jgi:hypothetical protein
MLERTLAAGAIGILAGSVLLGSCAARAQDTSQALIAITDTADKICGIVATSGNVTDVKVTGDVRAQLNGLAKRLADLGISAATEFSSRTYEGFIQQDLPAALKDLRDCKLKVFNTLQDKLIVRKTERSGVVLPAPILMVRLLPPKNATELAGATLIQVTKEDVFNFGYSQHRFYTIADRCTGVSRWTRYNWGAMGPFQPYDSQSKTMYIYDNNVWAHIPVLFSTLRAQHISCVDEISLEIAYKFQFDDAANTHFNRYYKTRVHWNGKNGGGFISESAK